MSATQVNLPELAGLARALARCKQPRLAKALRGAMLAMLGPSQSATR